MVPPSNIHFHSRSREYWIGSGLKAPRSSVHVAQVENPWLLKILNKAHRVDYWPGTILKLEKLPQKGRFLACVIHIHTRFDPRWCFGFRA